MKLRQKFVILGGMEIEFNQPIGESVLKEFLDSRGEGVHHLAFFIDNLDEELAKLAKKVVSVIQFGRREVGSAGYAYLDTDQIGGIVLEISQRPKE